MGPWRLASEGAMVMECPDCGKVIRQGKCPVCGWIQPGQWRASKRSTCVRCKAPSYSPICGKCATLELQELASKFPTGQHGTNGETRILNGVPCVWVNGYWINETSAPEWAREKIKREASDLTDEPSPTQLSKDQVRRQTEILLGMDGKAVPDEPPF